MKYRNLISCLILSLAAMSCQSEQEKYVQSAELGEKIKKECGASRRPLGRAEDPYNYEDTKPVEYFSVRCPDGTNYLVGFEQDGTVKATECADSMIEASSCWAKIK